MVHGAVAGNARWYYPPPHPARLRRPWREGLPAPLLVKSAACATGTMDPLCMYGDYVCQHHCSFVDLPPSPSYVCRLRNDVQRHWCTVRLQLRHNPPRWPHGADVPARGVLLVLQPLLAGHPVLKVGTDCSLFLKSTSYQLLIELYIFSLPWLVEPKSQIEPISTLDQVLLYLRGYLVLRTLSSTPTARTFQCPNPISTLDLSWGGVHFGYHGTSIRKCRITHHREQLSSKPWL